MSNERVPLWAILSLVLLTILWGVNWPILKIGLEDVPPFVFRACASMGAAIGMFVIVELQGHSMRVPKREIPYLILAGVLNISIWNIGILYGVDLMASGRAAILGYTMPLWATLAGAWVLKEKLGPRGVAGLALGLASMALLFFADAGALANGWIGPVITVAAAAAWGLGTVVVKKAAFKTPITVIAGWQHFIGGIPIVLIAIIWDVRHVDDVSIAAALSVFYNMTVTGVICYWVYFRVVAAVPVIVATVGLLATPAIGVIAGAAILGEQPLWTDWAALTGVAGAIWLAMAKPRKSKRKQPEVRELGRGSPGLKN